MASRWLRGVAGAVLGALAAGIPPVAVHAQLPAPPVEGTSALQIGGWAALTVTRPEHPEGEERLRVGEYAAALLAWGRLSTRATYFVELVGATQTTETWTGRERDERITPVRLYAEYTFDDAVRLRLGRFLTPVGPWNENHADPLTWTPTRPLVSYRPFAKSLSGLLLAGQGTLGGRDAGYAVFWAPPTDVDDLLSDDEEETVFDHAVGARIAGDVHAGLTLGMSLARVRRVRADLAAEDDAGPARPPGREGEREVRTLVGGDLRWVTARTELMAEAALLPATGAAAREGGVSVQGAVRLGGSLWGVARAERYTPLDGASTALGYLGLTWRGPGRTVIKVGRQLIERASPRIPDGWFVSFSSLF